MLQFWKRPKFWLITVLILWLAYVIGSNLDQVGHRPCSSAECSIPISRSARSSWPSAIFGALLDHRTQFMWRRGGRLLERTPCNRLRRPVRQQQHRRVIARSQQV